MEKEDKRSTAVIIAVIGAMATIFTACMTGFFGLMQITVPRLLKQETNSQSPTVLQIIASPSPQSVTSTSADVLVTPTPAPGMLFATKIDANGRAIDPGTTFPPDINEMYAVFPPGNAPPGTSIKAKTPDEGGYYAYLKVNQDSSLSSIGWRWMRESETIQEYEMDVKPGDEIWLSTFNHESGGLFGPNSRGPGVYRVIILLGGNPAMSSELTIKEK